MKKSILAFALSSAVLFTGCYGNMSLTKKVYNWNGSLGSDPIKTGVSWLLTPVYGATLGIDYIFLNTLEYWTGSNPIALEDGTEDSQIVKIDGKEYRIQATKNRFDIFEIQGETETFTGSLVYDEIAGTWTADNTKNQVLFAQLNDKGQFVIEPSLQEKI